MFESRVVLKFCPCTSAICYVFQARSQDFSCVCVCVGGGGGAFGQ